MSHPLLPTVSYPSRGTPLFVEVPVPTETEPYLVTSTRSLFWIQKHRAGFVRSAVRTGEEPGETVWREVVRSVGRAGAQNGWGNAFPATAEGCRDACSYVSSYGLAPVQLLVADPSGFPVSGLPEGAEVVAADWVPPGVAVAVPGDRSYLGQVLAWPGAFALVVHNPARGMALVGQWESDAG